MQTNATQIESHLDTQLTRRGQTILRPFLKHMENREKSRELEGPRGGPSQRERVRPLKRWVT